MSPSATMLSSFHPSATSASSSSASSLLPSVAGPHLRSLRAASKCHGALCILAPPRQCSRGVRCQAAELADFVGGDLLRPDLGRWLEDVEKHKALAIYTPHEGGYEGRYLNRLRIQGYRFLDLTARGLGDPESTLTEVHPVCPPHLGKQPIARWYYPPEVDYRLSMLPPNAKGLVVWVIEAKVLSKAELQFLALLPTLRPKVKVIAECGNWRKFMWKPLREISGLPQQAEE